MKKFRDLTDEQVFNLASDYHNEAIKRKYNLNLKEQESNKKFLGKCFETTTSYLLVIDSRSRDVRYVEALVFDKEIVFKDNPVLRKMFSPEVAFKSIDFKGVRVESINLLQKTRKDITVRSEFKEITKEEFLKEYDKYVSELKNKVDELIKHNIEEDFC